MFNLLKSIFRYLKIFLLLFSFQNCNTPSLLNKYFYSQPEYFTNSIGMKLSMIPASDFDMGCSDLDTNCELDEKPSTHQQLNSNFYIGVYEVTNGEYSKFTQETKYKTEAEILKSPDTYEHCHFIPYNENSPVICITWNDAKAFTNWLSVKENAEYRLPTEIEWEYSARGRNRSRYYWGDSFDESYVWFKKNSMDHPHPVGEKPPNAYGLHDILGNVWEWCENDYIEKIPKNWNPKSSTSGEKSLRGGSWFDTELQLRVSSREFAPPNTRENHYGFRVIRTNK